ncbi:hypothetical protein HYV84_01715 [Candidatus Woesearchaeota archaeon]|nr:hypothetical protein [Candidatus Woesearchaeota archaeon]
MSFDQQKRDNLTRADKSIKNSIDERIRGIVEFLNSLPTYFTTSSCSGRVMLLERKKSWKKDSRLAYREHEKADFEGLKKSISYIPWGDIIFKMESAIFHVCCRTVEDAQKLLQAVRDAGLKRTGIINIGRRVVVEILGTEFLEAPVAIQGELVASDEYLKILINEANKRLEQNHKRLTALEEALKRRLLPLGEK